MICGRPWMTSPAQDDTHLVISWFLHCRIYHTHLSIACLSPAQYPKDLTTSARNSGRKLKSFRNIISTSISTRIHIHPSNQSTHKLIIYSYPQIAVPTTTTTTMLSENRTVQYTPVRTLREFRAPNQSPVFFVSTRRKRYV